MCLYTQQLKSSNFLLIVNVDYVIYQMTKIEILFPFIEFLGSKTLFYLIISFNKDISLTVAVYIAMQLLMNIRHNHNEGRVSQIFAFRS